jgi:arylsulfatase
MKPNILLITVDQMRGDCLSALDHPVVETPNLDQLAEGGVLFRRAYTSTPSCIPARAAIFTGMSPRSHGRVGYKDGVPWMYIHTLPGELAKAGYHTQCIGKMHVYPPRNLCGFHNVVLHDGYLQYMRQKDINTVAQSFDQCDDYLHWLRDRAGAHQDLTDHGLDCNTSTLTRPWHLDESLHPTNWAVSESIDFLRRRDTTKPFFLWTSIVRPHPPFDPPQAWLDMYLNVEMPEPPIGDWVNREEAEASSKRPITGKAVLNKTRLDRARAGYYALITHIDNQIGRLVNALKEYGVLQDTLIVFTSDHGEMLGDHYYFRKALAYEGSARVPFIVSDPGGKLRFKRNHQSDDVIELRDIMPTVLDAAGVDIPVSVEGASLLPGCRGEQTGWREYVHGEHSYGELSHHYLTDGKMKYIWYSQAGIEQLFDLSQDPEETVDLVSKPSSEDKLNVWRERLITELEGREEGYSNGRELKVGCKPIACLTHIL